MRAMRRVVLCRRAISDRICAEHQSVIRNTSILYSYVYQCSMCGTERKEHIDIGPRALQYLTYLAGGRRTLNCSMLEDMHSSARPKATVPMPAREESALSAFPSPD
jgi:hypothetical protein